MMSIENSYWIGNVFYNRVGFIKAKDCKFNKDNFQKELEKELEFDVKLLTSIEEGYYRVKKSTDWEYEEYGEYCYVPCEKGKGAVLYYYAGFRPNFETEEDIKE